MTNAAYLHMLSFVLFNSPDIGLANNLQFKPPLVAGNVSGGSRAMSNAGSTREPVWSQDASPLSSLETLVGASITDLQFYQLMCFVSRSNEADRIPSKPSKAGHRLRPFRAT